MNTDNTAAQAGERDQRPQVPLWRLTGTFTLVTPLHIGTGRDEPIQLDEQRMGSEGESRPDETRHVATVVRDHQGRPCIPASSFKGALAALAKRTGIDDAQRRRLFGATEGNTTTSGGVEFTYLYADFASLPTTSPLPQFGRDQHPHVAHLAHVSRNRDTGVAEAQRLFLSQVVPPGVRFGFECTARGLSREDMGVLLGLLALAGEARDGLRLGAGKAADQGRVSWQPGEVWCLQDGLLAALWASGGGSLWTDRTKVRDLKATPQTAERGDWLRLDRVALKFHSPFLVYERTGEKGSGLPNGKPRTNHAGRAVLPSTSLHGALRAQAERILRTIGRETPAGYEVPGVQGLDDAGRTLDLASVLFGAPGWRSLLRCSDCVDDGTSKDITHHMLAIDRLTGGGKDSAKFAIDVRDCPTLNGSLAVDMVRLQAIEAKRPGVTAQVLGLLAHVLRDLDEGDIPLGYGASKGYGQLRSGTADTLRDGLATRTDVPDLTECLGAFAALSGADASDGLALQAAAKPARPGPGPARAAVTTALPAAQDRTFHNPYTFVPFGEPKPDDRRLPWLKEPAYRGGNLGHHAHGTYHAGTCHGRLICRLRATTPLFVGAGPVSDDASLPRKQENYRLGKALAIPATTLRGLFSSLHESITASALRVMTEQSYSMRVSANQHFPHSGMVIEVKGVRNGKPVTGYKIRHQKTGRESVAGKDYPFTVAAMERLYELADQRTESMKTDWPDGKVPADQIRPEIKPKGVARNREQHPFKARLMPGQTVFFRLSPDGTKIDEMAWSQIWRQRVEDTDKRPWKTTRAMTEPSTRAEDREKLTPMTEEARALSPSELLFGAVQVPAKRNKDAADEPVIALMGKVRFSAAVALPVAGKSLDTERDWTTLKILSSPKPPSPSFYFQPTTRQVGAGGYISKHEFSKNPKAYVPKGRKSYLHAWRHEGQVVRYDDRGQRVAQAHDGFWPWQSNVNLPPPPPKQDGRGKLEKTSDPAKQKVRAKLIPVGSEFEFSVDFFNLSETELSSLCAALMPAEKFEHKVGMGKPIGLGSVKIEPLALQLIDRRQRYRQTEFTASNRFQTLTCSLRDLAQEQMRHVAPDVRAALELVGNPDAVNRPVHYPQVLGGLIEQQTYQWFVENDRTGADVKRQWLKPLGEKVKELPTLERLPPMPTSSNAPGRPRGGR
ncbi:hypothetical protein X805_35680 [Sphaerotilus natans subsp. natans DSM 6575]|uniref:CRISPR type III-associated protein domain-containing protein n=1 Tax=Sphaerotilus natans subsp. natans DSM 6575 TaxID=1286631 RepID=A0A059KHW1_9BURK|nr:RAMP superfamily CRISPR-associated protein [Sphaerotilus natans]KDB50824.1 hypothetical protein X805_35680 [Sphaerotilus natans subsp. natans DSM 6575]SIR98085.1 CRISPR-associated protein [Sphaerotilus natans]